MNTDNMVLWDETIVGLGRRHGGLQQRARRPRHRRAEPPARPLLERYGGSEGRMK
jgi:hypothetical protein